MREYEWIPARDSRRACWEILGWFENAGFVRRHLRERYGEKLASERQKAEEIAGYVRQAIEYFQAAMAATLATRPTLFYYSMVQFSCAIALSSHPTRTQADLAEAHGLGLPKEVKEREDIDLPDLRVCQEGEGTWTDLLRAVDGDYYQAEGKPDCVIKVSRQGAQSLPRQGGTIPLAWVLHAFPSAYALVEYRYPGWLCRPIPLNSVRVNAVSAPDQFVLQVGFQEMPARAVSRLLDEHFDGSHPAGERTGKIFTQRAAASPDGLPAPWLLQDTPGGWFVYPDPWKLVPRLASFFLLSFCFGFLARYRPRQWGRLVQGGESMAVQIIDHLLRVAMDEVPLLALRELRDRHTTFGPSWHMLE